MIDILLVCDTNENRPWARDRLPGAIKALEEINLSWKILDIYSILGKYESNASKLNERFNFFHKNSVIKINEHFYKNIISYNPKILILCTVDNFADFIIKNTIFKLNKKNIYVSGFLGDDEFNYYRNRFFLNHFNSSVVYVKTCLDYYKK